MSAVTGLQRKFDDDFKQFVAMRPQAVALIDARADQEFSYAEVDGLMIRSARLLAELDVDAERPIMSLLPNSIENLVVFLAAVRFGYGFAPLTAQATPEEAGNWAKLVNCGVCLVTPNVSEAVASALEAAGVRTLTVTLEDSFGWLPDAGGAAARRGSPNSRLYLTTSGTTGEPKAMVHDGDRLWSAGVAFAEHHGFVDADSRFFNILPMSYLGGLFNLGLIPLARGGSTVVAEPFSGKSFLTFWQDVHRFEINVLWLVPSMVRGLLRLPLRQGNANRPGAANEIRACFLGTAPIDLATKEAFEREFGVPMLENFALSETTFVSSETLASRFRRTEHSTGEKLPYADIETRALPDDVEAEGGLTELVVRTPFQFLGYLDRDGALEAPFTDDGFMATGDLGHFDGNGALILDGRIRDVIKKGGLLVSVREIEVTAERYEPVEEAIGVPMAHDFYGEDLLLYVRFRDDEVSDEAVAGLRGWLTERLVKHKWPNRIEAVTDFPRTASGKVRKHALAAAKAGDEVRK